MRRDKKIWSSTPLIFSYFALQLKKILLPALHSYLNFMLDALQLNKLYPQLFLIFHFSTLILIFCPSLAVVSLFLPINSSLSTSNRTMAKWDIWGKFRLPPFPLPTWIKYLKIVIKFYKFKTSRELWSKTCTEKNRFGPFLIAL